MKIRKVSDKKIVFTSILFIAFVVLAFLICILGNSVRKNKYVYDCNLDIAIVDTYLLNLGFSQELIDTMLDAQKEIIYQHSGNEQTKFAGYETSKFSLDEDHNLSPVELSDNLNSNYDLSISVFTTHTTDSSGTVLYTSVYPSFVWNTSVKVKNDTFSMAVSPSWETMPDKENFRLHLMNSDKKTSKHIDLNPNVSSSSGYSYKISSDTGTKRGIYIGCAYFDIDAHSEIDSSKITLQYVHDKSLFSNTSYNVRIEVGDITLSDCNDKLCLMSNDYNIPETV